MPPQPENRSSSVNSAVPVSQPALFSNKGDVAMAGWTSTKGGDDTLLWTEISEDRRAIQVLKDWKDNGYTIKIKEVSVPTRWQVAKAWIL